MERSFLEQIGGRARAGLVLAVFASLAVGVHAAQLPADFTVEGRLYTAAGAPLSTAVDIKLELVDEAAPACVIYRELRPGVDLSSSDANAQGVFSLRLGAVTANFGQGTLDTLFAPGAYAGDGCAITAAPGSHRLVRVSVSAAGQNAFEHLTPDTRVTAVPVAMVAENAMTVQGVGTSSLLILNGTTALQQPSFDYLFSTTNYGKLKSLVDGTSAQYLGAKPTAPVPFDNQRLTNLADPTAAQDAVTKHYADTMIAGSAIDVSTVGPMTGDSSVIKWDAVQNKWVAGTLNTSPTGTAGGDLTGTYPAPQIRTGAIDASKFSGTGGGANRLLITDAVSGNSVGFGYCTLNQVYAWTVGGWACTDAASLSAVTSVAGKTGAVTLNAADITGLGTAALYDVGSGANQIPRLDAGGHLPAVDGAALLNINATKLQSNPVANIMPSGGQVLGWNGIAWVPTTTATGSVTSVGAGPGLLGGPITSSGTLRVDAGTAANQIVQLNPNAQLPALDGSLLTNLSASRLLGRPLSTLNPGDGQVLAWSVITSQWQPMSTSTGTMTSVSTGAGLLGGTITTSGTIAVDVGTTANKILQLNPSAQINAVDASLLFNVNAAKLQTRTISSTPPGAGQVLGWNVTTTQWEPTNTSGGTVTSVNAGTGLLGGNIVSSGSIAVDVGTTANKILQLNPSAQINAVDGSLLFNVNAVKLQTRPVSAAPPASGQVLGWNGTTTTWEPTSAGTSQWVTSGTTINYPTGNVGIGSTAPGSALTVNGDVSLSGKLILPASGSQLTMWNATTPIIQSSSANANGNFAVIPSGMNTQAALLVAGNSSFGTTKYTRLQQNDINSALVNAGSGTLSFSTNSLSNQIALDPTGRVGIGTGTPAGGLDVALTGSTNSAIIVPRDSSTNRPTTPVNGMLRYNTNLAVMEGYINGSWSTISAGSSAGTLQNITTGSGLLGGTITTSGTISVDAGSAAGKIVQENANAQIAQLAGSAAQPAYSFAGNVGTGVFSPGPGQLALATNGSAAMTIAGNGDVVFTGTTPSSSSTTGALQITGGLGVQGQISGKAVIIGTKIVSNAAMPVTYTGAGSSAFPSAAEVDAYNQDYNDGRLAQVRLSVFNAAATSQNAYFGAFSNTAGYTPSIVIGAQTASSAYAERLRIDPLGNLGVGTMAPGAGLDVAITGPGSAIIVPRDTTANRPSTPTNGMIRYNTNAAKFEAYQGGNWANLVTTGTSATAISSPSQVQFATTSGVGGSSNFTYAEPAGLALNAPLNVTGTTSLNAVNVNGPSTFNNVVGQTTFDAGTVGTLDMSTSNIFTSAFSCGTFTLNNLVAGASYTIIATDPGTSQCGLAVGSGTFSFRYMPPNDVRTANSHTIYNLMVVGSTVYVSWSSGFK